jgi:D-beta-D-heptose 7-phosphate kinase/D-beta-D-heptose 1-phosphate adenosyltransferase
MVKSRALGTKLPQLDLSNPPLVVVIGDVMIDHYLWGSCERISPEAPVQVVNVTRETNTLGGAANVAANLAALGVRTTMVGVVGDDAGQQLIRSELAAAGIEDKLVATTKRPTTIKRRVVAGQQQIVRVDHECADGISADLEREVVLAAESLVDKAAVFVLSDYGKGVLTPNVSASLIAMCRARGVPVLVDPKGRDYSKYRGATLVTPNRKEAAAATGLALRSDAGIVAAGRMLRQMFDLDACLITLSEDGMALFEEGVETFLPTEAREVFDVTGAGDTVLAGLALSLAAGEKLVDACRFANVAAGIVVGKVGSATVTLDEIAAANSQRETRTRFASAQDKILSRTQLARRIADLRAAGKKIVFTNGCFDILHAGHVRYLAEAAALGDLLVVGLNDDASVSRLKGPSRPINHSDDRALVLATLAPVAFVTEFGEDTPLSLIEEIKPDVLVKGGDYVADDVVGAEFVRSLGGSVEILAFLEGRSTTQTIARMASAAGADA